MLVHRAAPVALKKEPDPGSAHDGAPDAGSPGAGSAEAGSATATPEPPTGPRPRAWFAVAWLAGLGLAATIVGLHDAMDAHEIAVRLVGAFLLAGGLLLLTGAAGLRRRTPVGLSLAMLAALVGVAIGLLTFLTQVANDEPDRRLAAWALIILASGAAAIRIRAATPAHERAKKIWSCLPILKSAISVGLLVSVAQFWYSQIYVPTTTPPSLTLDTKVSKVTPRGSQLVIEGSVVIRNTSNTNVRVLASTLDIRGATVKPDRLGRERFDRLATAADLGMRTMADRYATPSPAPAISHGRLLEEGTFFEAGETITVPILTWVPKGRYEALYVQALIDVGRGQALGLHDASEIHSMPTPVGALSITRLPESSWMQRLTRGDRYLVVHYDRDPDIQPWVGFAARRETEPPGDLKVLLRDFWRSGADNVRHSDEERKEYRRLLRYYGLGKNPSRKAQRRLRLFYGTGMSELNEGYDRRLGRFYGVSFTSGTAAVSLP